MLDRVLVRAYGQEPLDRLALERGERTIFVCRPDLVEAVRSGETWAPGVPLSDVFRFDKGLFERLRDAYEQEDGLRLRDMWDEAEIYNG